MAKPKSCRRRDSLPPRIKETGFPAAVWGGRALAKAIAHIKE
ncbi:hypothetical protein [Flavonifractor plautii]|nr:hypothetical protein [Flavonifractor plautii]